MVAQRHLRYRDCRSLGRGFHGGAGHAQHSAHHRGCSKPEPQKERHGRAVALRLRHLAGCRSDGADACRRTAAAGTASLRTEAVLRRDHRRSADRRRPDGTLCGGVAWPRPHRAARRRRHDQGVSGCRRPAWQAWPHLPHPHS